MNAPLSQLVRELMLAAGLNENQLASKLGHSSSGYVHNVVTDKQPLSLKAVPAWAKALGVKKDSPEFAALESAAKIRKAKAAKASQPVVADLERRVAAFRSVLLALVATVEKQGIEIPGDLLKKIENLRDLN